MRPVERTILRVDAALLCAVLLWPAQPALAQFTQQGPKLVGSAEIGGAKLGFSVALSRGGNNALAGGPYDNSNVVSSVGAAWLFTRCAGNMWCNLAKLVGIGAVGAAEQGYSVALSADGTTALVGGPFDNGTAGATWVFTGSGTRWFQLAKLFGTGAIGSDVLQGSSVALSDDGNTAIVGGPGDNSNAGAAWMFTRSGVTWSQQKLVGIGAVGASEQGYSVALSGDGNTAIVGGPFDNSQAGAAWVFIRSGGMWSQQAELLGSGAVGAAQQGWSVALSADGNTAIVGGPGDNTAVGAAWVFTRSGGAWSQQGAKLIGTGAVGIAEQGYSVALSGDGNSAIVGGPVDSSARAAAGAAWVFTRSGGTWSQQPGNKLIGSGAVGSARQGFSVALSCNTAFVGGPFDNNNVGAAWAFVAPPTGTHDFNGDCLSDILWYNPTSGQAVLWFVNGTSVIGGGSPGSVPSPWAIVGQRDFNGDGYADILWRNGSTGQAVVWLLNGTSVIGGGSPGTVTTDWTLAGTGDFNGDGMGDLLWYNASTGQVVLWFLNGASVIGSGSPGSAGSPWIVAGTGDFNGDGMTDILWYNTSTGQVVVWFLEGTTLLGGGSPGSVTTDWQVAGTGDFNGDGFADILWYNASTGQVVVWLLNGASVIGGGSLGTAPSPWTVAQTGDFNGDCLSDILWYNPTSGQAVLWFVNGTSVIGGGSPGSAPSPWQIQGMNAD
jgi:hypothetical protein